MHSRHRLTRLLFPRCCHELAAALLWQCNALYALQMYAVDEGTRSEARCVLEYIWAGVAVSPISFSRLDRYC